MIVTVTMNPALDRTIVVEGLKIDGVNRASSSYIDPGGKGINVSKVIQALGEKSYALTILGGDTGKQLENAVKSLGIDYEAIWSEGNTRVNIKLVDHKKSTFTDINEQGNIDANDLMMMKGLLMDVLKQDDVLILSGSAGRHNLFIYGELVMLANSKGARVIVDAEEELLINAIEAKPYMIKPNINELKTAYGIEFHNTLEIIRKCKSIIESGISRVLVSMGEEGAMLVNEHEAMFARALPVEVKSTVGAGDAMVAAAAISTDKNYLDVHMLKYAMAVSAATVMVEGNKPCDPEVVKELMDQVEIEHVQVLR